MQPNIIAPAPWKLKGNGYIFLYRFSKDFVEQNGFLADYQQKAYKGDFVGTVMLVNYVSSEVGPYHELLFVPGRMGFKNKKLFSISKIYVSSYDSVYNGINNWGIPKELAEFEILKINENEKQIEVKIDGKTFFKVKLKTKNFSFPISTKFFPLTLAQKLNNHLYITNSPAKGRASFSKILNIEINKSYFPDISSLKPIIVLGVKDFEMQFPEPLILEDYFVLN
jgi:Acetoacetate decarboxylase (ADC)